MLTPGGGDAADRRIGVAVMAVRLATRPAILAEVGMLDAADPTAGAVAGEVAMRAAIQAAIQDAMQLIAVAMK